MIGFTITHIYSVCQALGSVLELKGTWGTQFLPSGNLERRRGDTHCKSLVTAVAQAEKALNQPRGPEVSRRTQHRSRRLKDE